MSANSQCARSGALIYGAWTETFLVRLSLLDEPMAISGLFPDWKRSIISAPGW